jgi:hypothetical protein
VSRLRTWPSRRDQEWTRRPGALPPMRMTASWSRSARIDRIQVCGAIDRASGELPSDHETFTNLGHCKACGYVDDRLRRPAPLPPLPEQARKAGKCSSSPTYPQAPRTREIDINENMRRGSACGPKRVHVKSLDTKRPIQVRARRFMRYKQVMVAQTISPNGPALSRE